MEGQAREGSGVHGSWLNDRTASQKEAMRAQSNKRPETEHLVERERMCANWTQAAWIGVLLWMVEPRMTLGKMRKPKVRAEVILVAL